ncbi:hypothetical protein FHD44_17070 [Escherichia coli]|nr:hypothetical protein [Escherichia coli]
MTLIDRDCFADPTYIKGFTIPDFSENMCRKLSLTTFFDRIQLYIGWVYTSMRARTALHLKRTILMFLFFHFLSTFLNAPVLSQVLAIVLIIVLICLFNALSYLIPR